MIFLFQCACKWVLKHQHKFKQVVRSCSLRVKEKLGYDQEEKPNDQNENDSEYTFRYSDLSTKLCDPSQLRAKPDVSELKFGQIFTDHMLKVFYHKQLRGWQKPSIIPFENISLHPAAKVLHYSIEVSANISAYTLERTHNQKDVKTKHKSQLLQDFVPSLYRVAKTFLIFYPIFNTLFYY
nr:unnamed protein product [Callosobruchus chinensis]